MVSIPICHSRSRDFSLGIFSHTHTQTGLVQKNSKETLSTEQPILASANAPHENKNRSDYDHDSIQDFYYCSDYVDWRDKLCKCPVPDVGESKSGFVSVAIPR